MPGLFFLFANSLFLGLSLFQSHFRVTFDVPIAFLSPSVACDTATTSSPFLIAARPWQLAKAASSKSTLPTVLARYTHDM